MYEKGRKKKYKAIKYEGYSGLINLAKSVNHRRVYSDKVK